MDTVSYYLSTEASVYIYRSMCAVFQQLHPITTSNPAY